MRVLLAWCVAVTAACEPAPTATPLGAFGSMMVSPQPAGGGTSATPALWAVFGGSSEGDGCVPGNEYTGSFGALTLYALHVTEGCMDPAFVAWPDDRAALVDAAREGGELTFSDAAGEALAAFSLAPFVVGYAPTDAALFEDPALTVPVEFANSGSGLLPRTAVWLDLGLVAHDAEGLLHAPDGSEDQTVRIALELNGAGTAVRLAPAELYERGDMEYPAAGAMVDVDFRVEEVDGICETVAGDVTCGLTAVVHTLTVVTPAR